MLKVLVKKQMAEIFRSYFYDAKKNKARSKGTTAVYFIFFTLLMAGMMGGIFAYLASTLCTPLHGAGVDWLYFAIMGLIAILFGAFGSVFNTYSTLYLAKDNDQMLSLPIPVSVLMASRLTTVYLMGLMYSGVAILPAVIVYWAEVRFSPVSVLSGLLLTLLISVFVLTVSCALGWVVAKISQKLKRKSLITVIVSLAFFAVYYFVVFKAQTLLNELLANILVFGEAVKDAAYPLYLLGSVGVGDPIPCLIVALAVAVLFALMWLLISRSFLKLATSSGKTERRVYKETAVKQKSISSAVLRKEFSRFLSSPNYMLNCGLGIIFLPVCGIALLWKGGAFIGILNEVFAEQTGSVPLLLCAAGCMIASMNNMAVPSVSLEGKSLWLLQSLPIKPWKVLRAKLSVQLLLTGIPMLFCILCLAVIRAFSLPELMLVAIYMLSFVLLSALFDLFIGLKMPNLNWTSEITAIKQSFGVLISIFGGFFYTFLVCIGFFMLSGWKLGFMGYMGCFIGLHLLLSGVLYLWLRKRGGKTFAAL